MTNCSRPYITTQRLANFLGRAIVEGFARGSALEAQMFMGIFRSTLAEVVS